MDRVVKRTKRQVEVWANDAKDQVEDAAHQVKGKAEHTWDSLKHAARDVKEKVTS